MVTGRGSMVQDHGSGIKATDQESRSRVKDQRSRSLVRVHRSEVTGQRSGVTGQSQGSLVKGHWSVVKGHWSNHFLSSDLIRIRFSRRFGRNDILKTMNFQVRALDLQAMGWGRDGTEKKTLDPYLSSHHI